MRANAFCLAVAIVAATAGCDGSAAPPSGTVGTTSVGAGNHDGLPSPATPMPMPMPMPMPTPGGGGGSGSGGGTVGTTCPSQATRLASGNHIPGPLAVDATYLYWADTRGGNAAIERVPKAGGASSVVTSANLAASADSFGVNGLAVDAGGIYWSTFSWWHGDPDAQSTLWAYDFAARGTNALVIASAPIRDLVVDHGIIYYSSSYGLFSVDTRGGTPQQLATLPAGTLAIDAWHIFVAANGTLYRVDRTTHAVETLLTGMTPELAVAVDFNSAYLADGYGRVWAVDVPGQSRRIYDGGPDQVYDPSIQLVGDQLYFKDEGAVLRTKTSGPYSLAFVAPNATRAIVDGDRVFFSSNDEVDVVCR